MKKIKERFLCVYLVMCMIFVLCPTVVYAEDAPGVYGDFYVVDNSTGAAVTAGNGVSYASGVLTVQRDGCRVKMKNGVTATTQRIIFDHRPTGSGHSQIILENVHINASDGIAIENKQGYADINFSGDCELIGTVGIQCDSGGGNVHVGMENESASLLAQGTKGAAFYCQSSIGFGCYGNPVTLIGATYAVSIGITSYLNASQSNMKAGADKNNLISVTGFDEVNQEDNYKYVTLSAVSTLTTHTIAFNANGGGGSMDSKTVINGRSIILPNCGFDNTNKIFLGWAQDNAAGTVYAAGTTISNITSDMIFDATWSKSKLNSITTPAAITGLANGTARTKEALGLPEKVTISTEDPAITTADVDWDLTTLASGYYDPTVLTEQTFAVNGAITLPSAIDQNGKNLTTTISVTVSAAVLAPVKPDKTISLDQASGGTISLTSAASAKKGDTVNVTAKADEGYQLSNIIVNGKAINGTAFIMPDEDVTVTAIFTKLTYKISVAASSVKGGTVTGAKTVSYGGSVILRAKAKAGYYFVKWTEKGTKVSTSSTLKIRNIKKACIYKAVFKKIPVSFVLSRSGNSIKVHWRSVKGARGYQIANNAAAGGKYKIQWTGSNSQNTYTSLYKVKGKTYKFKMRYYRISKGVNAMQIRRRRREDRELSAPNAEGNVWPRQTCPAFSPRKDAAEGISECWYCVHADFHLECERPLEVGVCLWPGKKEDHKDRQSSI